MKMTVVGLDTTATARAMIVAVATYSDDGVDLLDWTAYMGGSAARDHEIAKRDIANHGDKISRELAEFIFSQNPRWKLPVSLYRE